MTDPQMQTLFSACDYLRLLERSGIGWLPAPAFPKSAADLLNEIAQEVAECKACGLHAMRKHVVPGEGSPQAELLFVGEAPGAEEDRLGRPFVGECGDLLEKMIVAMHFKREEVFILNVLKCRPPENRNPEPQEVRACEQFLLRQIQIIQPKIIVTLGRFAAQLLLATTDSMGRLRGQWREYNGIPLMPTYHPSYLLRTPSDKRKAWEDLQKVMHKYEELCGQLPR